MKFNKTIKQKSLFFVFFVVLLASTNSVFAQQKAYTDEVSYKGNKVFYNGKAFSGWLIESDDRMSNECSCKSKSRYRKGKLNGKKQVWYRNGKLKESSRYKNGVIQERVLYYKSGTKKRIDTYRRGRVISTVLYNPDGSIKTPTVKKEKKPVKEPVKKEVVKKEPDVVVEEIKKNGIEKFFFDNGTVKEIKFWKDDVLEKDSLFYENSNLKMVKKFNDGELIHVENYSENKVLLEEQNFLNGKKHGIQKKYYINGKPKIIEEYDNDILTHREVYNDKGIITSDENYSFGKKDGEQQKFDDDGNLILLEVYNKGVLVKFEKYSEDKRKVYEIKGDLYKINEFNKDDKLISLYFEKITSGIKDSIRINYDPKTGFKKEEFSFVNGKKMREGKYKNNKKDGIWLYYSKDDKTETRVKYNEGVKEYSKTITYARQIKNNFKKNDLIYKFISLEPEEKTHYILVRIDESKRDLDRNIMIILNKLSDFFYKEFKLVSDINSIKEEELSTIISINNIKYKYLKKYTNSDEVIAYVNVDLYIKDFENGKEINKKLLSTPSDKNLVRSFYLSNKEKSLLKSINYLLKKIKNELNTIYPLKGIIYKAKDENKTKVYEISVYFNITRDVKEKDYFYIVDNKENALLRVDKIINVHMVTMEVREGKKWLKQYMSNHKKILVKKLYNYKK